MIQNQHFLKLLSSYDSNSLWKLSRFFSDLVQYQQYCRGKWDDSAAREIRTNYLMPQTRDGNRMITHLKEQLNILKNLNNNFDFINQLGLKIDTLSVEIHQNIEIIHQDLEDGAYLQDQSIHEGHQCQDAINQAIQLVNQANIAGS